MQGALQSREQLTVIRDLITAAMADCDAPGASREDLEELTRLERYRASVQDAMRGAPLISWDPDSQAMADYLADEGPNPLTVLGHSHGWRAATAEGQPVATPPAGSTWMDDVLALAQPVPRTAPPQVPPRRPASVPHSHVAPPARPHAVPDRDRIWLDVPYAERHAVQRAGAVWDPVRKSWYAPRPGLTGLEPWSRLPETLVGEDRSFGGSLFVDLIPATSWWTNARAVVSEREWFRIRQMVYRRAGQRCEACRTPPNQQAGLLLECHERWQYQRGTGRQVLRRLICLCSACHAVTHYGRTSLGGPGEEEAALGHLMLVARMNCSQAESHVRAAFRVWEERNQTAWTLDLSLITRAGIAVAEPKTRRAPRWAS